MLKLCFFVPQTHLEGVKSAVFAAGAGRIGDYEHCAWQVLGEGQFRPMVGSQPFLGQTGVLEKVAEYRVEMVLEERVAPEVIEALLATHPYETPAYEVYELINERFIN